MGFRGFWLSCAKPVIMTSLRGMRNTFCQRSFWGAALGVGLFWASLQPALAEGRVRGQSLFLPVFSELPYGDRGATLTLRILVDIRNLDRRQRLVLKRVDYIGREGVKIRSFIDEPREVKPFASELIEIKESDRSGGASSGFLIEWSSEVPIQPPLVQGVMVQGAYNQGISLKTEARVLESQP